MKKYRVTLTTEEREQVQQMLSRGKVDVRKLKHGQILLKADQGEGGPGWSDQQIADALSVGVATVQRVRQRFVEEGFEAALRPYRVGTRIYDSKLDGDHEAHLIALACSPPPKGRGRWTLRLLAQRMVELQYVDSLSHETVRQTLQKKSAPALSKKDVVHTTQALRRVRLPYGRRSGGLPPTL